MPGGDGPEAARGAPGAPDPLLELAGWHAEPALQGRLGLYVAEGLAECAVLAAALAASVGRLRAAGAPQASRSADPLMVLQLLVIPLPFSAVRLAWSLGLWLGYRTFRGASTPEILKAGGLLQRRSFWTHSAVSLECLSCLIMMWHIMMFFLLQGYMSRSSEDEKKFLWLLLGINIFCIVMHGCFWRDFVKNYREPDDQDTERFHRLERIYRMYRSKEITIRRYQEVSPAATPKGSPASCLVCMEEFWASDWVAALPCGHYYHPACTNTWLCERWACPLRCEVGPTSGRDKAPAPGAASTAARLSAAARQAAAQQQAWPPPPAGAGAAGPEAAALGAPQAEEEERPPSRHALLQL